MSAPTSETHGLHCHCSHCSIGNEENGRWWQVFAPTIALVYPYVERTIPGGGNGETIARAAIHLAGNIADEAIKQAKERNRL